MWYKTKKKEFNTGWRLNSDLKYTEKRIYISLFWISLLGVIYFCKQLLPFWREVGEAELSFRIWWSPIHELKNYLYFLYYKSLPNPRFQRFFPMISSRSFIILTLIIRSVLRVNFNMCVRHAVRSQISFCCWGLGYKYLIIRTICLTGLSFHSHELPWQSQSKFHWPYMHRCISGFYSIGLLHIVLVTLAII